MSKFNQNEKILNNKFSKNMCTIKSELKQYPKNCLEKEVR